MTSKTFSPGVVIDSPWLNDVNDTVYDVLGDGVSIPATKAAARTNLGLGSVATLSNVPIASGGTGAATVETARTNLGLGTLAVQNADAVAITGGSVARSAVSISPSFSAHNNAVNQSIPDNVPTSLSMSTEAFDNGGLFTASAWTPPTSRPAMLGGAVSLTFSAATGVAYVSVYKNGAEFRRGDQVAFTSFTGDLLFNVSCLDVPNGTDTYTLRVTQISGSARNTVGNALNTYFYGFQI